ncbi:helix-turn-helix transcriptional regulator [Luedemannella helvata]|uniref:HTH cro/C1-type domain-containing protein n=1 Tax=Luedemannella helvata TaxID=349315 RepID=A0ABP4W5T6_9ACTN
MRHDTGPSRSLGTLLVEARQRAGISQARLADRLCASAGVPTVTRHEISRWERGERVPSGFWLVWLALCLDVPVGPLERAAAAARRARPAPASPQWHLVEPGVYARTSRATAA